MSLIRLPKHYKETVISKPNAIAQGLANAAQTATKFITDISGSGIWVTPDGAQPSESGSALPTTTGWHISDAIELFKQGASYFKIWLENEIAKVRIGHENLAHVDISGPSTKFYSAEHAIVGGIFCDSSDVRQHSNDRSYGSDVEFVTDLYFMSPPSFNAGDATFVITTAGGSSSVSMSDYGLGSITIGNTSWTIGMYQSEEYPDTQVEVTITRTGDAVAWTFKGYWYSSAPVPKAIFGVPGVPNEVVGMHSIGDTEDLGDYSFTEGAYCAATGKASHAQNYHTVAASEYQTVIGCYNVRDANDTYALIIGNGAGKQGSSISDQLSRHNALTVDWKGNTFSNGYIRDTTLSADWTVSGSTITAGTHSCRRSGNIVTITGANINFGRTFSNGDSVTVGTIPAGYRPPANTYAQAFYSGGDLGSCYFRIDASGNLTFNAIKSLTTSVRAAFTMTFVV